VHPFEQGLAILFLRHTASGVADPTVGDVLVGVWPHWAPADPYRQNRLAVAHVNAVYGGKDGRVYLPQLLRQLLNRVCANLLAGNGSFVSNSNQDGASAVVQHGASGFGGLDPFSGRLFELQGFGFALRDQIDKFIVGHRNCPSAN